MSIPLLSEIFTDTYGDGIAVTWREFLGFFVKQFWPGVRTQIDKLQITRLDYPLIALPFFLLAVWATYRFWQAPSLRRAVTAGLLSGLLAYVYFHAWACWVVALGLFGLVAAWSIRREPERFWGMLLILGLVFAVAVPFLLNQLIFRSLPDHQDFLYRVWIAEGREVALQTLGFAYLSYAALAIAALWLWWRSDRSRSVFISVCCGAMVFVWNIQLVTGVVPAPDHWKKIASIMIFVFASAIFAELIRRSQLRWASLSRPIAFGLILLVAAVAAKKTVNVVSLMRGLDPWVAEKYSFPKEISESWKWMSEHIAGEPVVISSSLLTTQYLPVYTSARPYLPRALSTAAATRVIEERYLQVSRLFNVSEQTMRQALARGDAGLPPECKEPECYDLVANYTKTPINLYGCYFWRHSFNASLERDCSNMPREAQEALLARYHQTAARWEDIVADYVYYGPWERQLGLVAFRGDPRFQLVYENSLVEIYRIVRASPFGGPE